LTGSSGSGRFLGFLVPASGTVTQIESGSGSGFGQNFGSGETLLLHKFLL